ncbi:MAG: GAF domain-containing protein [Microcoleaceae cyanobacterium MO_207.B10]|nr:GAF domain-containing protein [Microcoleaceae cyanobacterium MO_207.B10]
MDCDSAVIYRFNRDFSGEFIAESVVGQWTPVLQQTQTNEPSLFRDSLEGLCNLKDWRTSPTVVADTYIQETQGGIYAFSINYRCVQDIYEKDFTPCYIQLLEKFQVRAYIIVPIFCGSQLWGLIGVYQNARSLCWSEPEINMVIQIGIQLGFAFQILILTT